MGYNDIRKPTKEEVEQFRHDVENMNSPADPDMSMQRQEDALGDFIKNLNDPIEKK
jgi:protein associated with RNAse G/E